MIPKRLLFTKDGRKLYVKDISRDFHTEFGYIIVDMLKKRKGKIKTSTGKEMSIIEPSFVDLYKKIKRAPQIISLKEIGYIIAETGINSKCRILDSGTGSGALACYLAHIVKEVISYEIRADFMLVAEENKKSLNLKNLRLFNKNIYDGIAEKNLDVIILDLPEPWLVIEHAERALRHGGFLVSYSPSIPQTIDFVNKLKSNEAFIHVKTIEIIVREWEIEDRRVRPKTTGVMHTGFLSFGRKVT